MAIKVAHTFKGIQQETEARIEEEYDQRREAAPDEAEALRRAYAACRGTSELIGAHRAASNTEHAVLLTAYHEACRRARIGAVQPLEVVTALNEVDRELDVAMRALSGALARAQFVLRRAADAAELEPTRPAREEQQP